MGQEWYYQANNDRESVGPVSIDYLIELVQQGNIGADARVRQGTDGIWVPIRNVKRLATELRGGPQAGRVEDGDSPDETSARSFAEPSAGVPPSKSGTTWWNKNADTKTIRVIVGVVIIASTAVVSGWWSMRDPVFRKPMGPSSAADDLPGNQESLLPPAPQVPSVRNLPQGVAQLLPGLEGSDPAFSPCLSPDLTTIVFSGVGKGQASFDLFIATRKNAAIPFGTPMRIESCASDETDAYPSLSPNGLELLFVRSDVNPVIMYSHRASANARFQTPVPWAVLKANPEITRVGSPQFIKLNLAKYSRAGIDSVPAMVMATTRENPQAGFAIPSVLPFSQAGAPFFVSSKQLWAYYGTEEGVFITARRDSSRVFGAPQLLVVAEKTGPIDGPVWVAPKEDVIVYCSPGVGKKIGSSRKLWMYRHH